MNPKEFCDKFNFVGVVIRPKKFSDYTDAYILNRGGEEGLEAMSAHEFILDSPTEIAFAELDEWAEINEPNGCWYGSVQENDHEVYPQWIP